MVECLNARPEPKGESINQKDILRYNSRAIHRSCLLERDRARGKLPDEIRVGFDVLGECTTVFVVSYTGEPV
jgi:hypothetical protein